MTTDNNSGFIQSLIETFNFEELSKSDQLIVLKEMTAEDYSAQRSIVLGAAALFSEANRHEPKKLIIEEKKSILLAPIPLYQVLIGIAAIAILMLLAFPFKNIGLTEQTVKYVTVNDTIIKQLVKYDTVETIIEKPVVQEKIVYLPAQKQTKLVDEPPRLLNVPITNQTVSLSQPSMQNKGVSLKDEKMLVELPRVF
ncbi:MAG: hypothetical protein AB8B72_12225 [Crocinitomicaceae bacterium]